jgi:phosphohistidine phosphatase
MNLYILRHAIAVEHGTPGYENDADRPLTDDGRRKLRRVAKAMGAMELSFGLILTSPYARARETAEVVARALGESDRLEFTEALTPAGSTTQLVDLLNQREPKLKNVLLVGHEPYLSELISLWVSGAPGCAVTMKKAGLCKLSTDVLSHGRCASMEWLLTPRQMGLIA